MRLFTAALPPPEVADHLAAALAGIGAARAGAVRWVPRDSWHITLGYYGIDDPATRSAWCRDQLAGVTAPRVRVTGADHFGATLIMRVAGLDGTFGALGAALRWNGRHDWQPHLTVGRGEPPGLAYTGPEWTIDEVVLLGATERHVYTVIDRFGLKPAERATPWVT